MGSRPNGMTSEWTGERLDILRELFQKGLSFQSIANEINQRTRSMFSRNACLGKASRMNLPSRSSTIAIDGRKLRARGTANSKRVKTRFALGIFGKPKLPTVVVESEPPPDFLFRCFEDIAGKFDKCHFPHGEGREITFCGNPSIENQSYCAYHYRLCYTRPTRSFREAA